MIQTLTSCPPGPKPQPVVTELNAEVEPCQHNTPGLPGGCQTYLSFMRISRIPCTLSIAKYRTDRHGQHGKRRYAALTYQKKPANADWGRAIVLVVPPLAWVLELSSPHDDGSRRPVFLTYTHSDSSNEGKSRRPYSDIPMFQSALCCFRPMLAKPGHWSLQIPFALVFINATAGEITFRV